MNPLKNQRGHGDYRFLWWWMLAVAAAPFLIEAALIGLAIILRKRRILRVVFAALSVGWGIFIAFNIYG